MPSDAPHRGGTRSLPKDLKVRPYGSLSSRLGITGKQYDELQFLAGRYLRQELENSMNHPRYQTSLDADKIDGVRNIIAATRVQARAMIRKRYPSIDLRAAKAEMDRLGMVR